ncbi:MAG: SBBP repeat-containing protein [Bacteroidetes bacterium]|nr:SBBP repeat-containing protein [Bacteroidota bacterium]
MKKILFLNILVMLKLVSWSQKVEWVSHFGGKSTDYGDHITTDNAGNIYTIGTIEDSDSIDFKASKGNGKLLSPNIYSFFILKTNPQGKTIWVKQIGNKSTYITTHAIKCDNKANVYIIGYFINTVDFDPGPDSVKATAPNSNAGDAYIVKLDSSGQFSWLKVLSSTSPKGISSINFDDSNYMYMCGTFSGSLDFDLGSGTYYLSSSTGTGFVAKMNSTGDLIWAKKFDGQDLNTGISCSIDSYSNVYTIGYYFDSVDFDPGPAKHMLYNNSSVFTMYLCKLDKNGSFVWVKNFSGAEIIPHEVSVDKNEL